MSGRLTAIAGLVVALLTGWLVHSYDQAQHDRVVADLRAEAATTLADQTATVLGLLQDQIDRTQKLEEDYARADQATSQLRADGVRLSADLDRAVERVRQLTRPGRGGGGGAEGKAGSGTDSCAAVRAALDRALAAVELLKSAGDEVAADGQHAVDVATIAAREVRLCEGPRE